MREHVQLDALIIGGGVAGLWALHTLRTRGVAVWLVEANALGAGQTMQSQGIIHGGLKYALGGKATEASTAIADMPKRWADAFDGPLQGVQLRSRSCLLWSTGGLGRLAMVGAKLGLRAKPTLASTLPPCLDGVPKPVLDVPETVVEPASVLNAFAHVYSDALIQCDGPGALHLTTHTNHVHAKVRAGTHDVAIDARCLVLLGGGGNAPLRASLGLDPGLMQERPLRMVLARGDVPVLNGHVIKGTKPWLTITTTTDAHGVHVWQIGGDVAERGASMSSDDTIAMAKRHLQEAMPTLTNATLDALDFGTVDAPRFEGKTDQGHRPETPTLIIEGRVCTGWPSKLALAPLLADQIASHVSEQVPTEQASAFEPVPATVPRPQVAHGPWTPRPTLEAGPCETIATWNSEHWARAN